MNFRRRLTNGFRLLRSQVTRNSAILLYHRVAEGSADPFNLCVAPRHFEEQMECIARSGSALAIDEFTRLQDAGELPQGSISVTFDDGYLDVLENALPILEKYELPVTIYTISGVLGQCTWWDRLIDLIEMPRVLPERIELELRHSRFSIDTGRHNRKQVIAKLYSLLLRQSVDERQEALATLEQVVCSTERGDHSPPRIVSARELHKLAEHPLITIGAHTVNHARLVDLVPSEQFREIDQSVREISAVIGTAVTTFSYPFGIHGRDYTEQTMEAVRSAGLKHALAADLNVVTSAAGPLRLPRLWVHDVPGRVFWRRLGYWL